MRCYRSDSPELCLFCCSQPSCVVSQKRVDSGFFFFLFTSRVYLGFFCHINFPSYSPQSQEQPTTFFDKLLHFLGFGQEEAPPSESSHSSALQGIIPDEVGYMWYIC